MYFTFQGENVNIKMQKYYFQVYFGNKYMKSVR